MTTTTTLDLYTPAGLARAAGLSKGMISIYLRDGRIQTVQTLDGLRLITRAEAERWMAARRPAGRPAATE